MTTIGIVIFDDVEELDFVGPWEVFTTAAKVAEQGEVKLIAQRGDPVRCAKGMRVLPDHTFADAPPLDVVLVPGGQGTRREATNPVLLEWLRAASERATWITSVCTGALLLYEAGLARGKRVTTHWAHVEELRAKNTPITLTPQRYVDEGSIMTASGVSAGIDMSLYMIGKLWSPGLARKVQKGIEYFPEPPYGDVAIPE